jgi:hypothetical protein
VVAHRDEKVKEQTTTSFHLVLHGTTPLESMPAPDNQSKVMGAQPRVTVWRIGVRVTSARQNGPTLDTCLQALLTKRQLLQLRKTISLSCAIDHGILEQRTAHDIDPDGILAVHARVRTARRRSCCPAILEMKRLAALVIFETRIVVAFVEVFEDRGEDSRFFIGKINSLAARLEELIASERGEEGRMGQDILVSSKETLLSADADGDDGGCQMRTQEGSAGLPDRSLMDYTPSTRAAL